MAILKPIIEMNEQPDTDFMDELEKEIESYLKEQFLLSASQNISELQTDTFPTNNLFLATSTSSKPVKPSKNKAVVVCDSQLSLFDEFERASA